MRQNRIYVAEKLIPEQLLRLSGNKVHYLHRVLRLGQGDNIILFNGDGCDYASTISAINKEHAEIEIATQLPAIPESPLHICLVQAVARGERMDTSLQKATELGISEIQPLLSERVEVKLGGERLEKRLQHWQGVLISACEQSGRAVVPKLRSPVTLGNWLAEKKPAQCYVLHPRADTALTADLRKNEALALLVGPEGGFSDTEVLLMQAAGVLPVHLGRRILRTETAGPAAIAAIQAIIGDMS